MQKMITDAAVRLADLEEDQGNHNDALWALRQGFTAYGHAGQSLDQKAPLRTSDPSVIQKAREALRNQCP